MRRVEPSRLVPISLRAEPRKPVALRVEYAHPRPKLRTHPVRIDAGEVLPNIDQFPVALRIEVKASRARQVNPLRLELPFRAEYLYAMVLAVCHIHPAILVHAHVVDNVELPRVIARLSPREQVLAIRRILMHRRVGIAVPHIEVAVARIERNMRGRIERLSAHRRRRLTRRAYRHQDFAMR